MTARPVLTCCVCGKRRAAPDGVKSYKRPRVLAVCHECGITGPHWTGERREKT